MSQNILVADAAVCGRHMFIGAFITALLLLSGGSPQEPQDATLLGGPSLADREIPLDDWDGGGGGDPCVCNNGRKRPDSITRDPGQGSVVCPFIGCSKRGSGVDKVITCNYAVPMGGLGNSVVVTCR
jgi:hypothetical protein